MLECLETIEEARAVGRADHHTAFVDTQAIGLVGKTAVNGHGDVATGGYRVHSQMDVQCALRLVSKFAGIAQGSVSRGHNALKFGKAERTIRSGEVRGIRHQGKRVIRLQESFLAYEGKRLVLVGEFVPKSYTA